jgi:Uma2 family endonuclease
LASHVGENVEARYRWLSMSASSPARANATYEALQALPDDVRAELVAGAIEVSPSPTPEHGRAQRTLGHLIGGPFDDDDDRGGHGGWWIIPEVDIRLSPHDVVRPDLAGWRRERLPNPWGRLPIEVVPDWICEIVSTNNAAHDRVTKRRLYAAHGLPYYWLVDPTARTLEALKLDAHAWVELGVWGDGDVACIDPFAAVELEIGRLFPPRVSASG